MFTEPLDTDAERSTIRRAAIRVLLLIQHQLPAWQRLADAMPAPVNQQYVLRIEDCYQLETDVKQLADKYPDTTWTVHPYTLASQLTSMNQRLQQVLHQIRAGGAGALYHALATKTPLLPHRSIYVCVMPSTAAPVIDLAAVDKLLPGMKELYAAQQAFDELATKMVSSAKATAKQTRQAAASDVMSTIDDTFQPPLIPDNILKHVQHSPATDRNFVTTSIASKTRQLL